MSTPLKDRFAVALRYDAPDAPRVVATGRGLVGQKIIDTAEAHGVPLQQNPALARALASIELDAEIPPQLYLAVAEILAFLMHTSRS